MKKILVALTLPALLVSCSNQANFKEVSYAEFASKVQEPSTLKKPTKCVAKYSGSIKSHNADMIPGWTIPDQNIKATCKFNIASDGDVTLVDGSVPTFSQPPSRLSFQMLELFETEERTDTLGFTLTCDSTYYLGAVLKAINECVGFKTISGGNAVIYYMFDYTYNTNQWVSELHCSARLNYYKNTLTAYAKADVTATYSYTY